MGLHRKRRKSKEGSMAIAPEYIAPEPITDVHEFSRRARETFNLGTQYLPDVGTVLLELNVEFEGEGAAATAHLKQVLAGIREKLTQIDDARFKTELADAVIALAVTEDLRPLLGVLTSWFRTSSLEAHPEYAAAKEWARNLTDDELVEGAVDAEDLIAKLHLEDTA